MRNWIKKIKLRKSKDFLFLTGLIIVLLLALFVPLAFAAVSQEPGCETGYLFSVLTGESCLGGDGGGGDASGGTSSTTSPKSKLFVSTGVADNITQTSAILHGTGGDSIANPTLPATAYFRYSILPISPVFCNDIYGANMISTSDLSLGTSGGEKSFFQKIYNLTPNTTYYYCAIISNRENIAYGGSSIVKEFHTNCLETTVETKTATNIRSTSASLKGSYCSTKESVRTSFEYKEVWDGKATPPSWKKVGETNHVKGTNSNVYGNINFNLSGLESNKEYEFKAVAKTSTESPEGITLNFKTTPGLNSGGGGRSGRSDGGVNNSGGGGGVNNSGGVTSGGGGAGGVNSNLNNGTWGSNNGGKSGTWGSGIGSGTWISTSGTGGTGAVTWTGTGNGSGTWKSATGSGTWTNGKGTGGAGTGTWTNVTGNINSNTNTYKIINTTPLVLGQVTTPPNDAIVRYHEGIETVFTRQIIADKEFAKLYGYQEGADLQTFAWNLSDRFARMFGYINESGREIRVSFPDIAAYQLQLVGNKLTVYEYYSNKIVDIRNITAVFKNASGYEYYFKK